MSKSLAELPSLSVAYGDKVELFIASREAGIIKSVKGTILRRIGDTLILRKDHEQDTLNYLDMRYVYTDIEGARQCILRYLYASVQATLFKIEDVLLQTESVPYT